MKTIFPPQIYFSQMSKIFQRMFSEETCPTPAQNSKGTVEALRERNRISWIVGGTGSWWKTIRAGN